MNDVQAIARLYDARDAARRLLGSAFKTRMEDMGSVLKTIATKRGAEVVPCAIQYAEENHLHGLNLLWVMAAAIELIEPTPEES